MEKRELVFSENRDRAYDCFMKMAAEDRIGLILVKIDRAREHLRDLEALSGGSDHRNAYDFGPTFDPLGNAIEDIGPLVVLESRIPAMAGDAIHNLRCALDHLVFQLIEAGVEGGTTRTAKPEDIGFPIFETEQDYTSNRMRKVHGARRQAIAAIDALRPYRGGDDLLWRLHRLDINDKHQSIISIGHRQLLLGNQDFTLMRHEHDPQFTRVGGDETSDSDQAPEDKALLIPTLRQMAAHVSEIVSNFFQFLD